MNIELNSFLLPNGKTIFCLPNISKIDLRKALQDIESINELDDINAIDDFLCSIGYSLIGWTNYPVCNQTSNGSSFVCQLPVTGYLLKNTADPNVWEVYLNNGLHAVGRIEKIFRSPLNFDMFVYDYRTGMTIHGPRSLLEAAYYLAEGAELKPSSDVKIH